MKIIDLNGHPGYDLYTQNENGFQVKRFIPDNLLNLEKDNDHIKAGR
jgi:hypothetical protein